MMRWLLVGYLTVITVTIGGGAAYAGLEHVSLLTGCYWALTTATTVGYGDVTPHDPAGRLLAMGLMLVAIPAVAWAFAQLTSHLSERRLGHTHDMHRILADLHRQIAGFEHPSAPRRRENDRSGGTDPDQRPTQQRPAPG